MTRTAVIGIGKMGMLHAGILNGLDTVELCAVSDNSGFLLSSIKGLRPDLEVYEDYIKMLDEVKPDAVVIATPVFLHVPMARACLERNIPFLLEKPLCPSSAEAESLVHEIAEKGLTTHIGYMLRYVETFMKAKEILNENVLGKLITFRGTIYVSQLFKTGKGWRYSKEKSGGGVVSAQATHLIDLLYWYFGKAARVSGHTKNWYSREVEDFAHAYFEFDQGVSGFIDSSWSERHHRLMQVEININAEFGSLTITDDFVKLFLDKPAGPYAAGWTNFSKPDLFEGVEIDLGGPQYTRQDVDFIKAVQAGKTTDCDFASAWEVQKMVDALYESASGQGKPINLG